MKLFCHISDFGTNAWQAIPVMATIADEVTIWAPSHYDISHGNTQLLPEHLVRLVELDRVRLIGREGWFTDSGWRASRGLPDRYAQWHPEYDGVLKEIALESRLEADPAKRKIIMVGEENGNAYADELLSMPKGMRRTRDPELVDAAERVLRSNRLPEGLRQRLTNERTADARLRFVIRAITNHSDAVRQAGADRSVILGEDVSLYGTAVNPTPRPLDQQQSDLTRLPDLLDALLAIAQPATSADDLIKRLDSKDLELWRSEARALLHSQASIPHAIFQDVTGYAPPHWSSAFNRRSKITNPILFPANIIAAAAAGFVTDPRMGMAIAGVEVGRTSAPPVRNVLERWNWVRARPAGRQLANVVAFGRNDPYGREILRLAENLRRRG